jgi:hypothetical protein
MQNYTNSAAARAAYEHGQEQARLRAMRPIQRIQEQVSASIRKALGGKAVTEARNREAFVMAMSTRQSPIYAGTVSAKVIAKRRARNRMARMSRRANRG